VPTRTRRKKSKPKPERCEPRRRETHHTHRNLSGANLDRVVRRADAADRTTIGTGYMMNKGDWIWRVGKAVKVSLESNIKGIRSTLLISNNF
jgi:hypothetical protein